LGYPTASVKRPQYFGVLTNDIAHKRLVPGVLEELKRVTPKNDSGRPKITFFQTLTTNIGYPKLREQLGAVVAIMKLRDDWTGFREKLDRLLPRHDELPLTGTHEDDDGKGL
jgi:P63C domain